MNDGESTKQADPLIGATVGEYVVGERLGTGAMGIVYRGVHSVIGKQVAIKVLRTEGDVEQTQRLLAEARTVSTLRHRGIADIFGFGALPDGRPYIVMELLEGKPLDQLLRSRGSLPVDEALWMLEEALGPLAEAHAGGVVHRDIKPSNFFVSEEADGSRYLKVLDFGLAKRRSGENLTAIGSVLGTPDYMSPEQAQAKQVGPAADIYSLGATAFELLTGGPPFVGNGPMEIMVQHVHHAAPRVSSKVHDIPGDVDDLIAQMLEKDPQQRPGSAAELKARVARMRRAYASDRTVQTAAPRAEGIPTLPPEPESRRAAGVPAEPVSKRTAGLPAEPVSKRAAGLPAEPVSKRAAGLPAEPVSKGSTLPDSGRRPGPRGTGGRRAVVAPPVEEQVRTPVRSGGTLKWALLGVGALVVAAAAALIFYPRGEAIPNTPPESPNAGPVDPFAKEPTLAATGPPEKARIVAAAADAGVDAAGIATADEGTRAVTDGGLAGTANAQALATADGGALMTRDAGVPAPVAENKRRPVKTTKKKPAVDRSVEARIRKDEALLRARARGRPVSPVALGFLRSFKDELKRNPASRERVAKQLTEWEQKFLR